MIDLLGYGAYFLTTALTYAVIVLGLNLQWGQTGLFNVGVAGFVAIGAYASALLTTPASAAHWGGFGLPYLAGWVAAALVAGGVASLVALLTIRLKADYLAITSFGIAVVIHLACLNAQTFTGGPFGIGFIPRPFATLADRPLTFAASNLALVGAVLAAVFLTLERLVRGPWGRVLRALREDETAAAAAGKNPVRFKVQAFGLGGAIMGFGGALQAHWVGFIAPENYLPNLTFQVWTMLILGGSGNNRGAVLGAVLVWGLWSASGSAVTAFVPPEWQARAAALQIVFIGIALCAVLLWRPRGIIGERAAVSRHVDDASRGAAARDAPG